MNRYRARHLARAFMRGLPYRMVEFRTRENNKADPLSVAAQVWRRTDRHESVVLQALLAAIEAWLSQPATTLQLQAFDAARARQVEAKRARSEATRATLVRNRSVGPDAGTDASTGESRRA